MCKLVSFFLKLFGAGSYYFQTINQIALWSAQLFILAPLRYALFWQFEDIQVFGNTLKSYVQVSLETTYKCKTVSKQKVFF